MHFVHQGGHVSNPLKNEGDCFFMLKDKIMRSFEEENPGVGYHISYMKGLKSNSVIIPFLMTRAGHKYQHSF